MEIELSGGATADLFAVVGSKRGVVLVPDIQGRRTLFRRLASGLASDHGWNVIVVDVFGADKARDPVLVGATPTTYQSSKEPVEQSEMPETTPDVSSSSLNGDAGTNSQEYKLSLSTAFPELNSQVSALDDQQVVGDLVEAADRLEVDPVAIIGFCVGGAYVLKAAASHRFDRLVSFGGKVRLPKVWHGQHQREPLELLAHVEDRSNILAIVGMADADIVPEDVEDLDELGVKVECFEGADQGFAFGTSQTYRPQDSAVAWSKTYEHINQK